MVAMAKQATKVQSGGRVSIDSEIRKNMGIEVGDYVVLDVKKLEDDSNE